jgi:iron-sulfur cluster assembly accessory protein
MREKILGVIKNKMVELTDAAISKAIERTTSPCPNNIRLGVSGGGCAGYEYIITYSHEINNDDNVLDYGKFKIVINEMSKPYLEGSTIDWVKEGLNEYFKIINPKEVASCGCGISVQFEEN